MINTKGEKNPTIPKQDKEKMLKVRGPNNLPTQEQRNKDKNYIRLLFRKHTSKKRE